jgi:hypothetical protein
MAAMIREGVIAMATAAIALFAAEPTLSQSVSSWRLGRDGAMPVAEGFSQSRGGSIRLECVEGKAIWLRFSPPRGWNGAAAAAIRIDDLSIPVGLDGSHDGALLSDLPNDAIGISRKLLDAIKTGKILVVEGPATARVPAAQRTFPLGGAGEVVAALERRCPGLK